MLEGAGLDVPEFDGAVAGGGGEMATIGRELDSGDAFLVAVEGQGRSVV